jgi:transcriptional regulator with XRE-family HTH domain
MNELYKNIKKRRQELSMTQQELAEKIGYTDRSSVAKIENGRIDLSQSKIMQIAKALETTPGDLMGSVEHEPQYYDDETVQIVTDRLRTNPEYSVLFKASANVRPEDIDLVTKFIEKFSD